MQFIIDYTKENEARRVVKDWGGLLVFLALNIAEDEYESISTYVLGAFAQGYPLVVWQWANGDSFEIYCPANASLLTSVQPPVVINPLRKFAQSVVSAIL